MRNPRVLVVGLRVEVPEGVCSLSLEILGGKLGEAVLVDEAELPSAESSGAFSVPNALDRDGVAVRRKDDTGGAAPMDLGDQ
ncbi:hypothetical protein GCM10010254_55210 [Streptomyces chromofuscus]|nr:hypothetical protein GCM10010254_55210 [Streptomyces chromofuscus]